MHNAESNANSRKNASYLRVDDSHSATAVKSEGTQEDEMAAAGSSDNSLQVEPFPFSHVTSNEQRRVEIQVGETRITESRLNSLRTGDVVKLDSSIDDDVVIWCEGRRLASGKMVVANGRLAVLLAETPDLGNRPS